MILEIPEVFQGIGYFQGLSLILWLISAGLLFFTFIMFMHSRTRIEMKSQKMMYIGYGLFALFFGLTRLAFIAGFYFPDDYDFYTTLGYILAISGMLCWLYMLETYLIKKTKRMFFLIMLIGFVVALISLLGQASRYFALQIIYIIAPFAIAVILFLYLFIIVKTTGTIRKKAIWVLVGLIFLTIGYLMDSEMFVGNFPWVPLEVAPILMIVGTLIFLTSQLRE